MKKNAIVLLSGGLDSTTALAIAKSEGYRIYALSFRYGQRHLFELERAKEIAISNGVEKHAIVQFDLRMFGGSALTTSELAVPTHRSIDEMSDGIPVTYVPARNTIFLSFALAWAETIEAKDLFIGVNALDYSGYPDCRPEFIEAYNKMANLATKAGVEGNHMKIHTPLIAMTKAEIIRTGDRLGVDYSQTHSCYNPTDRAIHCGECDACILRKKGFSEAQIIDPTEYTV